MRYYEIVIPTNTALWYSGPFVDSVSHGGDAATELHRFKGLCYGAGVCHHLARKCSTCCVARIERIELCNSCHHQLSSVCRLPWRRYASEMARVSHLPFGGDCALHGRNRMFVWSCMRRNPVIGFGHGSGFPIQHACTTALPFDQVSSAKVFEAERVALALLGRHRHGGSASLQFAQGPGPVACTHSTGRIKMGISRVPSFSSRPGFPAGLRVCDSSLCPCLNML
jgi:hypothetical protein